MLTIPTNLTIRDLGPVKSDSWNISGPIKVISGYYRTAESSSSGLSDENQAKKLADSFVGTEVMFDIVLYADVRSRITGHMYKEGTYGEFIFMTGGTLTLFYKTNGTWSERNL